MTKPPITLIDNGHTIEVQAAFNLRAALNENPGTYWVPGKNGHWELAATPLAVAETAGRFEFRNASERVQTLNRKGEALRGETFAPHPHRDLPSLGAATSPWEHQSRALAWLLNRTSIPGTSGLLYLGLGTGKTRTVLDWLRIRDIRRALVVAPKSVLPAWEKQAEMHYPGTFIVHLAMTGSETARAKAVRNAVLEAGPRPIIIVVNYDIVWRQRFAAIVEQCEFEAIIADECHRLKGRSSRRSVYFRTAWKRHPYRIALTGTPLSNGVLSDAFGQYAYLDPGAFGLSITRFEERYAVKDRAQPWLIYGWRDTEDFYRRFWSLAHHEPRSVLSLPEVTEETRFVTLPQDALRAYAAMRDELILQVRDGTVTAANAAVAVNKLQQLASGRVLGEGIPPQVIQLHTEKRSALEEILRETGDEPIVVFATYRQDLRQIHEAAKTCGLGSLELSGSRSELAEWQGGQATVLAVQIQSGSEGIDLTRASYGVFFSPSYALAQMDQAKARLHRPGQTKPTTFLHILARQTIDLAIHSALRKKLNFVQSLISSRGEFLKDLTLE